MSFDGFADFLMVSDGISSEILQLKIEFEGLRGVLCRIDTPPESLLTVLSATPVLTVLSATPVLVLILVGDCMVLAVTTRRG